MLSCSHQFHLRCIATWFYSVEVETCPNCRKETSEQEKMPIQEDLEGGEEEEEDNDYVRLPNGQWVPRLQITIQNETFEEMPIERSVRNIVEVNEETDLCARIIQCCYGLYRMRKEAAKNIQRVWRGYSTREILKRRSTYVAF